MFELEVIGNFWAIIIGIFASLYALYIYDPQQEICLQRSESFFQHNFLFQGILGVVKVLFYAAALALTVSAIYFRRRLIFRLFKFSKRDSQRLQPEDPKKNSLLFFLQSYLFLDPCVMKDIDESRDYYWQPFFDKWIVISVFKLVASPFITQSQLEVTGFINFYWIIESYAVLSLLQGVCYYLAIRQRERNQTVMAAWHGIRPYAQFTVVASLLLAIISLILFFQEDTINSHIILLVIRLFITLVLVYCFINVVQTIHFNYKDLLIAVLHAQQNRSSVLSDTSSDTPAATPAAGGETVLAEPEAVGAGVLIGAGEHGHSNDGLDKSSSYNKIYFEINKLLDLIKMASVIIIIDAVNTINVIFLFTIQHRDGDELLFILLYYLGIGIPFIYMFELARHKVGGVYGIHAVDSARDLCIKLFYLATLSIMSFMGTNYGCTILKKAEFRSQDKYFQGKFAFFAYFNRAMIYQSITSFGLSFLTSPGARSFYQLQNKPVTQMVLLPLIWASPFTIQRLHEVSGENYVLTGILHTLCWIGFFSKGYFLIQNFINAVVTGIIMLIFSMKLLWPPGRPLPFAKALRLEGFERFLKDSKYGSYHVYLAIASLFLYCIHSSFLYTYVGFPYFLFPLLAWGVLRLVHSSTRQYLRNTLSWLCNSGEGSLNNLYKIKSTSRIPLRGTTTGRNATWAVTLTVVPPDNIPFSVFKSSACDLVMLRNESTKANANLECVHYFSVVSIQPVDDSPLCPVIDITLMIQVTPRPDGITTMLTKKDYELEEQTSANGQTATKESCNFSLAGITKSSALEALNTPSIVTFAFDSGAAAFCALLRQRSFAREIIDRRAKHHTMELFKDLCVVWVNFMPSRPRGELQASHISKAVEELCTLQHFLYQKSGGRGTKLLFVITGIPQEWTPAPECPSHKIRGLEEEVAKLLNVSTEFVKPDEWDTEERVLANPLSRNKNAGLSSIRNTLVSLAKRGSINPNQNINSIDESICDSDRTHNSDVEIGARSTLENPLILDNLPSTATFASKMLRPSAAARPSATARPSNGKPGIKSIRHSFNSILPGQRASNMFGETPEERLSIFLQIQAKEESWVPLRHALASKWSVFKGCLEFRIHSLFKWLYDDQGPDYTSIFITEHMSDIDIFRDFRYQDIYNEINRVVLENQLRYCKNPKEFLGNTISSTGDPVNSSDVSCAVLYSGDFQSAKKDQLAALVKTCQEAEEARSKHPATLSFVPDG